jgi:hypothetical protein
MTKYQPYSRREFRALFRQWAKRNRKKVAIHVAGALFLLAFETVVLFVTPLAPAVRWYVLGAIHAAVIAAFAYALNSAFLAHDQRAIGHLRGAWGEDNTRSELERARRKRVIWGWVDSVTLQAGDIDHLVVTRAGGLVAIDSKWRNQADAADHQAMVRAANKAKLRAEALFKTLLKAGRGTHRARSNPFRVTPVVVLWGAVQTEVPEGACIDGIDFIRGGGLLAWLKKLNGDPIEEAAAADILQRLEVFRSSAWTASAGR